MALECRIAQPGLEAALASFFADLDAAGDGEQFHPHPLDAAAAYVVCRYEGLDLHYVLVDTDQVLAYGILRGWDAGFEVPSLGIAVHPSARGTGVARALMGLLHLAARRRGAPSVRLRVYPGNARAIALYRSLGYEFTGEEDGQLVGQLTLA